MVEHQEKQDGQVPVSNCASDVRGIACFHFMLVYLVVRSSVMSSMETFVEPAAGVFSFDGIDNLRFIT